MSYHEQNPQEPLDILRQPLRLVVGVLTAIMLLLLLALSSCHDHAPLKTQSRYAIYLAGTATPVYCDSVQAEDICLAFWRAGKRGRVCGSYRVYHQQLWQAHLTIPGKL